MFTARLVPIQDTKEFECNSLDKYCRTFRATLNNFTPRNPLTEKQPRLTILMIHAPSVLHSHVKYSNLIHRQIWGGGGGWGWGHNEWYTSIRYTLPDMYITKHKLQMNIVYVDYCKLVGKFQHSTGDAYSS